MIKVTSLPIFVTHLFRGMPGVWKAQHRLMLSWLIVMQALFPGRKTVAELARWTPIEMTEWRCRRLLSNLLGCSSAHRLVGSSGDIGFATTRRWRPDPDRRWQRQAQEGQEESSGSKRAQESI